MDQHLNIRQVFSDLTPAALDTKMSVFRAGERRRDKERERRRVKQTQNGRKRVEKHWFPTIQVLLHRTAFGCIIWPVQMHWDFNINVKCKLFQCEMSPVSLLRSLYLPLSLSSSRSFYFVSQLCFMGFAMFAMHFVGGAWAYNICRTSHLTNQQTNDIQHKIPVHHFRILSTRSWTWIFSHLVRFTLKLQWF